MEDQKINNTELLNEIRKLQIQISCLEQKIDNTNGILVDHISFINNVFDIIKKPLFFIMGKVNHFLIIKKIISLEIENQSN